MTPDAEDKHAFTSAPGSALMVQRIVATIRSGALDATRVGVAAIGPDGHLASNLAFRALTGHDADGADLAFMRDMIEPADLEALLAAIAAGDHSTTRDVRVTRPDGTTVTLATTVTLYGGPPPADVIAVACGAPTTESEDSLLDKVLGDAPDPLAVAAVERVQGFNIDEFGYVVFVDRALTDLGIPAVKLVGAPSLLFIHPEDQTTLIAAVGRLRSGAVDDITVSLRTLGIFGWTTCAIRMRAFIGADGRIAIGTSSRRVAEAPALPAVLSPREQEIFDAICSGDRVATIARRLYISPSTVRNHLSAIFGKLGVSNQATLMEQYGARQVCAVARPEGAPCASKTSYWSASTTTSSSLPTSSRVASRASTPNARRSSCARTAASTSGRSKVPSSPTSG